MSLLRKSVRIKAPRARNFVEGFVVWQRTIGEPQRLEEFDETRGAEGEWSPSCSHDDFHGGNKRRITHVYDILVLVPRYGKNHRRITDHWMSPPPGSEIDVTW